MPTATLSLSAASASVVAGASSTVTVTVTANVVRGGGFAGAVTVAATGAPTGVSVTGATIANGSTSATVTIATTASAVAGVTNISITASGTGVTVTPVALALTVTAAVVVVPVSKLGALIQGEAAGNSFGQSTALSADGTRLIVGAPNNSGNGADAGHARVYQLAGTTWTQLGGDIDGEAAGDQSGFAVAMSSNGNRVAVGAWLNNGPNGTRVSAGHVRVHDLVGGVWTQVGGDVDPPGGTSAGSSVAMSGDGQRLLIGAPERNGSNGYAFVYQLTNGAWVQMGASLNVAGSIDLGTSVDISEDGGTIAVGTPGEDFSDRPGSTYLYRWNGIAWAALGGVIIGEYNTDASGSSVALSGSGNRVAIGAPNNRATRNLATSLGSTGQVRVYELSATNDWVQVGADIDGVTDSGEQLGYSVDMSRDGKRLIASAPSRGLARVYVEVGGTWKQLGGDLTGGVRANSAAISADGSTASVGFTFSNAAQAYRLAP